MSISISKRLRLTAQITRGLFLTDLNRSPWGRVWQILSRFTWELPQTLMGWLYSVGRALTGQIGTFVDLWTVPWMRGEGEDFVLANQVCQHEFGHTIDSQRFGWFYLPLIGLPSLLSALGKGDHNHFWTEIRANRHARRYFSKHYAIAWNETNYPTLLG